MNNNSLTDPNPPYVFSWTGPNGYSLIKIKSISYIWKLLVTITDSNNCAITIYTNVQEPDQLEYTLYNITGSSCYGLVTVLYMSMLKEELSPYSWDGDQVGTFPFTNPITLQNDSMILDLCANDYDIYVTDENDCIGTVLWEEYGKYTIDSGVVVTDILQMLLNQLHVLIVMMDTQTLFSL